MDDRITYLRCLADISWLFLLTSWARGFLSLLVLSILYSQHTYADNVRSYLVSF